jgi:predicted ATP-dependent endonuclease of OLD family
MPAIRSLTIEGFRGFTSAKTVRPCVPGGKPGSGLTIIVGPNNSGKSTITEAIIAVTQGSLPRFHLGQRNVDAGDRVKIEVELTDDQKRAVRTVDAGGSQTVAEGQLDRPLVYALPSRRQFASSFGEERYTREQYAGHFQHQASRESVPSLHAQLNRIAMSADEKTRFDALLNELMGYTPTWAIETHENGQNYLKYTVANRSHSSGGLGDGIVSLFSIAATLHAADPGTIVVIDEPELSLHPQFQRRLLAKLVSTASDMQIIITTHSPLLIGWQAIADGTQVIRTFRGDDGVGVFPLSEGSRALVRGLLNDRANPHVLGLDASEVFFYEDGILLVEGQEDVLLLPEVAQQAGIPLKHALFGWGVGGADKMHVVASILKDLGFKRVAGLLDADKKDAAERHRTAFPDYHFFLLPADDVRSKEAQPQRIAKVGLLDGDRKLRPDLVEATRQLLRDIDEVLS